MHGFLSYFFHHVVEVVEHLICQPIFELLVSTDLLLLKDREHQILEILFILDGDEGLGGLTEEAELTFAHDFFYKLNLNLYR